MHEFCLPKLDCDDWWDLFSASQIAQGKLYASYCEYGRFHSNYTSLSKDIRARVQLNDCPQLTELDIRNCQPLLLSYLAGKDGADVTEWKQACEAGEVYEQLASVLASGVAPPYTYSYLGRECTVDPKRWARDDIKRPLLVAMFCGSADTETNPAYVAMRCAFPSVAAWLTRFKREAEQQGRGYQELAKQCQRLESSLMVKFVCRALREAQVSVLTVHDALIVPAGQVERTKAYISQAFQAIGLKPSIEETILAA